MVFILRTISTTLAMRSMEATIETFIHLNNRIITYTNEGSLLETVKK